MSIDTRSEQGQEKRHEDRATPRLHVNARLLLRVSGLGDIAVDGLRNVSSNGASLLIRQALAVGTSASLVLITPDVHLEFLSEVAWCRPSDNPASPAEASTEQTLHTLGLQIRGPGSFAAMVAAH